MDVELIYAEGCPNVGLARARVAAAAERAGVGAAIRERVVSGEDEAATVGMRGSPTVLVAGADVASGGGGPSLGCRLYLGGEGVEGAPTVDEIAAALAGAAGEPGD